MGTMASHRQALLDPIPRPQHRHGCSRCPEIAQWLEVLSHCSVNLINSSATMHGKSNLLEEAGSSFFKV